MARMIWCYGGRVADWFLQLVGRGRFLRRIVGCGCVGRCVCGAKALVIDAESQWR